MTDLISVLEGALDWHWDAAPGVPSSRECLVEVAGAIEAAGYRREEPEHPYVSEQFAEVADDWRCASCGTDREDHPSVIVTNTGEEVCTYCDHPEADHIPDGCASAIRKCEDCKPATGDEES